MGYCESLDAAGADVLVFEEFGSYQGDWWAKVIYNGETGWVNGSYGSCSSCDSFQSEIGYHSHECKGKRIYIDDVAEYNIASGCETCISYKSRLAEFGVGYLFELMTHEEAIKQASKYGSWDSTANSMTVFIESHKDTITEVIE